MRSHSRRRSPEGSFQGTPLSCTRRPGACPTMRTLAVGHARSTGFGGLGRCASQIRQARTSASSCLKPAALTCMLKLALFVTRAPSMPPLSPLSALSPLDGRYHKQLEPLRACFSEAALFRYRIAVEIRWLLALAAEPAIAEIKPFSKATHSELERIIETFSEEDAAQAKAIEAETHHDVKAIEYWLNKRLGGNPEAARVAGFVHFACTSEDINNLAYGLMLKEGRDRVLLPSLDRLGVSHREDERRGGQLQCSRRRIPELRLAGLRQGVRRVAGAGVQFPHDADRAARQLRRAIRRGRARQHRAARSGPRSVGLHLPGIFQAEDASGRDRLLDHAAQDQSHRFREFRGQSRSRKRAAAAPFGEAARVALAARPFGFDRAEEHRRRARSQPARLRVLLEGPRQARGRSRAHARGPGGELGSARRGGTDGDAPLWPSRSL